MIPGIQTPEGEHVARLLAHALDALAELPRNSTADAERLCIQLVAHIRSAWPQALLSMRELP